MNYRESINQIIELKLYCFSNKIIYLLKELEYIEKLVDLYRLDNRKPYEDNVIIHVQS